MKGFSYALASLTQLAGVSRSPVPGVPEGIGSLIRGKDMGLTVQFLL